MLLLSRYGRQSVHTWAYCSEVSRVHPFWALPAITNVSDVCSTTKHTHTHTHLIKHRLQIGVLNVHFLARACGGISRLSTSWTQILDHLG